MSKREEAIWRTISKVFNIFNFTILTFFFFETLARASLHTDGWAGYFKDNWNKLDLLVIMASGTLELVEFLMSLELSQINPLIAIVRLCSSLRTVSMLYGNAINNEELQNESLQTDIRQLEYDLDLRESDNTRLDKELTDKRKKIKRTEDDIETLKIKVMQAQGTSWDRLVPTTYALGITENGFRCRSVRSFSS